MEVRSSPNTGTKRSPKLGLPSALGPVISLRSVGTNQQQSKNSPVTLTIQKLKSSEMEEIVIPVDQPILPEESQEEGSVQEGRKPSEGDQQPPELDPQTKSLVESIFLSQYEGSAPGENPEPARQQFFSDMIHAIAKLAIKQKPEELKGYEDDRSPPDWELAETHARANSVGETSDISSLSAEERKSLISRLCPCCSLDPANTPLSLCSDLQSVRFLGAGYVLYFQLIKFAIFLCFIMSLFQIYKLRENIMAKSCSQTSPSGHSERACSESWVIIHSIANYGLEKEDLTDKWLMIGFLCLYYLLLAGLQHRFSSASQDVGACEWTLQISFDKSRPSEDKIRELIYRIAPNVKIQKINSCYKLDEFTEQFNKVSLLKKELRRLKVQEFSRLREEKNKLIAQERENRGTTNILGAEDNLEFSKMATEKILMEPQLFGHEYFSILHNYEDESRKLEELRKRIPEETEKYYTGISFITFETRAMAKEVLSKLIVSSSVFVRMVTNRLHRNNSNSILQDFEISRAPQPSNIFWQNMGIPRKTVVKARVWSYLATLFLIAVALGSLILLKEVQLDVSPDDKEYQKAYFSQGDWQARWIGIAMMFVVVIINSSLAYTLRILNGKECYTTTTAYMAGLTIKIAMAQFINSNLLIVLTHVLVLIPKKIPIDANNGLLLDALNIMIGELILGPILVLVNPLTLWRVIRKVCLKVLVRCGQCFIVTQKDANKAAEKTEFDPACCYSALIRSLLMILFMQPIFPIGSFLAVLGFSILFWASKVSLLKFSARPLPIDADMFKVTIRLLSVGPLIVSLSWVIFDAILFKTFHLHCFAFLGATILMSAFPAIKWLTGLIKCLSSAIGTKVAPNPATTSPTPANQQATYQSQRDTFQFEYDRSNPITAPEANREYFDFLLRQVPLERLGTIADQVLINQARKHAHLNSYFSRSGAEHLLQSPAEEIIRSNSVKDQEYDILSKRYTFERVSVTPIAPFNSQIERLSTIVDRRVLDYFLSSQSVSLDPLSRAIQQFKIQAAGYENLSHSAFMGLLQPPRRGVTLQHKVGGGRFGSKKDHEMSSRAKGERSQTHTVQSGWSHFGEDDESAFAPGSTNRDLQGSPQISFASSGKFRFGNQMVPFNESFVPGSSTKDDHHANDNHDSNSEFKRFEFSSTRKNSFQLELNPISTFQGKESNDPVQVVRKTQVVPANSKTQKKTVRFTIAPRLDSIPEQPVDHVTPLRKVSTLKQNKKTFLARKSVFS